MCVQLVDSSSTFDTDSDIRTLRVNILEEYEGYIRKLAGKLIPQQVIRREVLDLELDDLVQTVLVKFWEALNKRHIDNYKSYLQRMVHNEAVNLLRKSRFNQPLDTDEEGEPYYGNVLVSQNEGTQDPLAILEEKESVSECIHRTVETVIAFPPLQRKAMLCLLKDRIDYMRELLDALRVHHIDVEQLSWSGNRGAIHSMKVSASLARKKLKALQKASLSA